MHIYIIKTVHVNRTASTDCVTMLRKAIGLYVAMCYVFCTVPMTLVGDMGEMVRLCSSQRARCATGKV